MCLPDVTADSTVTFSDGTQLLYSPVLSERSDTPTWVWLFAPDVTDDALNDTENYTVTDGKGPVLTVGRWECRRRYQRAGCAEYPHGLRGQQDTGNGAAADDGCES